ncbi:MAG TPA: hypothetical protein PLW37_13175 [bacterium]|nr:hypothetical protein [bacterium]
MNKERLNELRAEAEELINCGNSKEKSRGYGMVAMLDALDEELSLSFSDCTIAILTSSNPADACDPVIERAVFAGPQESINNAVRDQLIEWAETYFDLSEKQLKDFREDPDYCSSDSECTGDYTVIVEHNCRFVNLTTERGDRHG